MIIQDTNTKGEAFFMKQLMKYWKQLLGVVIVLVVSVIGVRSLAAVNEGISISRIEPEVNQLPYGMDCGPCRKFYGCCNRQ